MSRRNFVYLFFVFYTFSCQVTLKRAEMSQTLYKRTYLSTATTGTSVFVGMGGVSLKRHAHIGACMHGKNLCAKHDPNHIFFSNLG